MNNKSKRKVSVTSENMNEFKFNKSFKNSFDELISVYSDTMNSLSKSLSGKGANSDYGVCCCDYKLRFITPANIATYISNMIKALSNNLFKDRISDVEMFTVASVKRFIEENGCVPFEQSSAVDDSNHYVNPKEATLSDLAYMCKNDMGNTSIYSKGEILTRIKLASEDAKKLIDMHFAANMKKIVNDLPSIISKSDDSGILYNKAYMNTLGYSLEEFILFACTINTISALQLIGYCSPAVEYTTKTNDNEEVVTECCMHKTNDFMIRNRLPFNCNMRDVVLQDVTPTFKDVHDALHFIMKDSRSPISVLVNKFASKEASPESDYMNIANMFIGMNHCHPETIFKNTGEKLDTYQSMYQLTGFDSQVDWLDNIAFGNNYLDGNYRRDGVGNHKSHPILNILDVVFRMFSGCHLKSNEDIANNIVRVACAMREIIHAYNDDKPIENYQLTKDILVVLGEIFTRNMLRLYYNNTLVVAYTDDMVDAAAPGFVCLESFYLEADENNNANASNNANNPSVSFADKNGNVTKTGTSGKIGELIQKFLTWIRNSLSKVSENFNKNHAKEIEYVNKNKDLNEKIGKAISDGLFKINTNNLPNYKLSVNGLMNPNISGQIDGLMKVDKIDKGDFIAKSLTNDTNAIAFISKEYNDNATNKTDDPTKSFKSYILFGSSQVPQTQQGVMDAQRWNTLCSDITGSAKAIEEISKVQTKQLEEASTKIKNLSDSLNNQQGDDVENKKNRIAEINNLIQNDLGKTYIPLVYSTISKQFFATNYKLYVEIVNHYKSQQNNLQNQQNNSNNNTTQVENQTNDNSTANDQLNNV